MLSVGLGGYAEQRGYSYCLSATDPARTVSGRMAAAASSATFADLSSDAIAAFEPHVPARYHNVDITTPLGDWPPALSSERFEVVVIGEVLEHLDNPGAALRNLYELVTAGGQLVVTVPNAFSLRGVVRILAGRETTHPEHASHYSYVTIQRLLRMNDLPPSEILWYRWTRYGGTNIERMKRTAAAAVSSIAPQLSHGLIAVVTR